jgi:hypothetical protein
VEMDENIFSEPVSFESKIPKTFYSTIVHEI